VKLNTHSVNTNGLTYNVAYFENAVCYRQFVDEEMGRLLAYNQESWKDVQQKAINRIRERASWFGTPPPESLKALEEHKAFLGMALMEKIRPRVRQYLDKFLSMANDKAIPKPKIAYNDRGLGVFSFDRAAMALFEHYKVDRASGIGTTVSQLNIELQQPSHATSVKKVFAFFENKNTSYPSIQLYFLAGANSDVQGDSMLYVGIAGAELIAFLEARGVAVEVNVIIGTQVGQTVNASVVCLKRYEHSADLNQLLLHCSDPRFFRFRGFKGLVAISNYFNTEIPPSLGRIEPAMGRQIAALTSADAFVFEQSYSLESASQEVLRIINEFSQNVQSTTA